MWKNKRKNRRLGGKYMNVGDYVRTDIGTFIQTINANVKDLFKN